MQTVKEHLRHAIAQLGNEREHLEFALKLAADTGYDPRWIEAINKAIDTTHEAERHLHNVRACIQHPAEPPYHLKPGIIRPRAL